MLRQELIENGSLAKFIQDLPETEQHHFEAIPFGLILVGLSGDILSINSKAGNILKLDVKKALYRKARDVIPVIPLERLRGQAIENIEIGQGKASFVCSLYPLAAYGKSLGTAVMLDLLGGLENSSRLTTINDVADMMGVDSTGNRAGRIITASDKMQNSVRLAARAALTDITVLIQGESGCGKEILARAIHNYSKRAQKGAFIQVNCGAIPEGLIESELFGYEAGAFSGAGAKGKPGMFELANGGTLLLDEIGELPLKQQVKLLRVLQEREVFRVGGVKPIKVDARIIAATNKNLQKLVAENTFREDLFYRLNVFSIDIPPLRERKEDVEPLASYFLDMYSKKYELEKKLTDVGLAILTQYDWPGNVRELKNLIERMVVVTDGQVIGSEQIRIFLNDSHPVGHEKTITVNGLLPLREAKELVERELILLALGTMPSIRKAAEALGVDHSNMLRKMAKYNIEVDTE